MTSTLLELNPNSIWLEITETIQNEAWEESAAFASQSSRQRAYINLLSQKLIIPYLQEEVLTATIEDNQASFWELGINGSVIKLDNQRLILIPSEAIDTDELRIPQEWVDIPDLVADYYLAVQVDTEENLLRIWGYTTHHKLKEQGTYTRRDRSYSLDREDVTEDVDSLWLIREYFAEEPTLSVINPLAKLSLDQLTQLLDTLANPELVFPRRAVAFEEWGAIISNDNWRKMLVNRRNPQPQTEKLTVNLSQWFENKFAEGWQAINDLISPQIAPAFRSDEIKRVKDLGLELSGNKLALMITIGKIESGMSVQVSVYPTGEQTTLPPSLKLIILTEAGEVFKEVTSLSDDEFIRYKFEAERGDKFRVKVALGGASITEEFQV